MAENNSHWDHPKRGLIFFSSLKAVIVEQQEASNEKPEELALICFKFNSLIRLIPYFPRATIYWYNNLNSKNPYSWFGTVRMISLTTTSKFSRFIPCRYCFLFLPSQIFRYSIENSEFIKFYRLLNILYNRNFSHLLFNLQQLIFNLLFQLCILS